MTLAGRRMRLELLQWFALVGGPVAWALQHVFGIALTLAQCDRSGQTWNVPVHGLTIASTAVAATVAAAGMVCALVVMRAIDPDEEEPPASRIRFLAVVALTVDFLFLCIVLMSGTGVVLHETCHQS